MEHNPAFLKLVEKAKQGVREVSVGDVKRKLDGAEQFHFIDVREDHEFVKDHAQGAIHLGRGILERDIGTLIPQKGAEIILYCGGGLRSTLAAESLGRMGYTNVSSMAGGIRAWREADYPIWSAPA